MNFWNRVTGNDITMKMKNLESRALKLPRDFQMVWKEICSFIWPRSDITGRNVVPVLEDILELLEETATSGQSSHEILGGDIDDFCQDMLGAEGSKLYRDRWRRQLNDSIAKKLGW